MTNPTPTVVWTEIPVTDLTAATKFYEAVFGWTTTRSEDGPNPMVNFADEMGIHGHLYPGKPADEGQGPTLHLRVPDTVAAAAERVTANGGTVMGPVIQIPPGQFQYAQDPDGNSIGLFEAASA